MPLLSAVRYEYVGMRWLRLVGSIKLQVSFAKEPYKRDDILQKRPVILSILLTVATPHHLYDESCDIFESCHTVPFKYTSVSAVTYMYVLWAPTSN